MTTRPTCPTCEHYLRQRLNVLTNAIVTTARTRGISPFDLAHRYKDAIHRRHQAGLLLATEPPTRRAHDACSLYPGEVS